MIVVFTTGGRPMHDDEPGPALDHVVLAARSRDDIDEQLAELGLSVGSGRAIPGAGLSNVVVAVGTQLLELHYPDGSPVDEGGPPFAQVQQVALRANPDSALVPVAWLVRYATEDLLREASTRVGYPVMEIPPEPPNNAPYLLGGFGAAFERPWLPALIYWTRSPHLPPPLVDDLDSGPNEGWLSLDVSAPDNDVREWCGSIPSGVDLEAGLGGPLRVWHHQTGADPRAIGLPTR
jgi:Glyoxalase-like domain